MSFVFLTSPHQLTHQTRKDTSISVFLCLASFLHPATHIEHEETQQWCLLMFGVFPTFTNARWTQWDTCIGVFLCSASFLHSPTHAEHEETPLLVSFHARRLFYTHRCTLNMRRHHHWCLFIFSIEAAYSTLSSVVAVLHTLLWRNGLTVCNLG